MKKRRWLARVLAVSMAFSLCVTGLPASGAEVSEIGGTAAAETDEEPEDVGTATDSNASYEEEEKEPEHKPEETEPEESEQEKAESEQEEPQKATDSEADYEKEPAPQKKPAAATKSNAIYRLAETSEWDVVRDLVLNVVSPEDQIIEAAELEPSIKIFLFGDIDGCGNTKGVLQQLNSSADQIQADFFYLDIKKNSAVTIRNWAENTMKLNKKILLSADPKGTYQYGSAALELVGNGFTMPAVLVVGEDNETLLCNDFSGTASGFAGDIEAAIAKQYPEAIGSQLAVSTDTLYLYPGMSRRFPLKSERGAAYSSGSEAIAEVAPDGTITAKKPGTVRLTAASGGSSVEVTLYVLEEERPYYTENEWEVLKLVNSARMKSGKRPVSMARNLQKAAHVRAYEQMLLYSHTRPDGSDANTVFDELGIDYRGMGENIAMGQSTPSVVMDSWMNSSGHRENILKTAYVHIGIGEKNKRWVQMFLNCGGSGQSVSGLVKSGHNTLEAGGKLSDLDYYIAVECPVCGEAVVPVIDEMCTGFDPDKTGSQQVTVTLDNWSETFTVAVEQALKKVTKIQLSASSLTLKSGEEEKLTAAVAPSDADDKRVQWTSSNTGVAVVDNSGTVKAVGAGTATIYAEAMDGSGVRASCRVTVKGPVMVTAISLNERQVDLREGKTVQLKAAVSPYNADNKTVEWTSSDPAVAVADGNGLVTAKKAGTAVIQVKTKDGSNLSASCKITVYSKQIASGLDYPSEAEVRAYYEANPFSLTRTVTYDQTPSMSPYKSGILSERSRADGLNSLNLVRYIAGLSEVESDSGYEDLAMKASIVNAKNGSMSHYPKQPSDMADSFYADAKEGASSSNLAWASFDTNLAYGVIRQWMDDGDSSNISHVGHRRWCLNPSMEKTGFGYFKGHSAMYSFDRNGTSGEGVNYVAWPAGNMPRSLMYGPWSVSVDDDLFAVPDKSSIKITVTNGSKTAVIDQSQGTLYVSAVNYGFGDCIIFDPGISYSSGDTVKVTISGLKDQTGDELEISYAVHFFDMKIGTSSDSGGGSSSGGGGGSSSGGGGGGGGGGGSSSSRKDNTTGPGTSGSSLPSYVIRGTWSQNELGQWTFTDTAGTQYKNAWAAVENPYANTALGQQAFDWFRFDENGFMVTGWFLDPTDGYWYYLNPVSDNTRGRMFTGWAQIDGKYHYFNPNSDGHRGRMYVNETTPDGYYVNAEGVWVQ